MSPIELTAASELRERHKRTCRSLHDKIDRLKEDNKRLRKKLEDFERLKEAAANFLASRDIAATVESARNQDMAFGDEVPDYREDCERIVKVADTLEAALKESEETDDT